MNANAMEPGVEPARADLDASTGPTVIEFGASWCGVCHAAQPLIGAVRQAHPDVRHLKVEDGPGRPLGRSFGVKLWPTLVFLRDGREVARVVRPRAPEALQQAYAALG
jgi:thioredoxin 1